jgi:hypothetical protein
MTAECRRSGSFAAVERPSRRNISMRPTVGSTAPAAMRSCARGKAAREASHQVKLADLATDSACLGSRGGPRGGPFRLCNSARGGGERRARKDGGLTKEQVLGCMGPPAAKAAVLCCDRSRVDGRSFGTAINHRIKSHLVRSTFDSWRADAIDGSARAPPDTCPFSRFRPLEVSRRRSRRAGKRS